MCAWVVSTSARKLLRGGDGKVVGSGVEGVDDLVALIPSGDGLTGDLNSGAGLALAGVVVGAGGGHGAVLLQVQGGAVSNVGITGDQLGHGGGVTGADVGLIGGDLGLVQGSGEGGDGDGDQHGDDGHNDQHLHQGKALFILLKQLGNHVFFPLSIL